MRPRLTYANVVATLALVIAVGGGAAYAANTVFSSDIVDGQVKTPDLDGGAVISEKVADQSLKGRDVFDNTLKGADIDESTLSSVGGGGAAGGDLTGTYPNPLIAPNAVGTSEVADGSLTGFDVNDHSLTGSDIALEHGLGGGASPGGTCDPDDGLFRTCTFTTINVPRTTRVLVIGTVQARLEPSASEANGQCRLATNLGVIPNALSSFNVGADARDQFIDPDEFVPLIGMVLVGSGSVDFGIECNDLGNIQYADPRVAAMALSPL